MPFWNTLSDAQKQEITLIHKDMSLTKAEVIKKIDDVVDKSDNEKAKVKMLL
jgi:hypothetical protein